MKPSLPLIRVGVLACGRYVHTRGIWGPLIQPELSEQRFMADTRMTRMVVTHAWDVDPEAAREFAAAQQGVCLVESYHDMVGQVDAVILDDHSSCLHFKELARPYLEAGVPMFINRPLALSLADAEEILNLSRKHGTPIMSGSSFEFAPEVTQIRRAMADVEPISGYAVANSMSDYATHGVHGVLFALACVGGGVTSAAYQTPDWHTPNGIVVIEHAAHDGGRPFYGCVQEITGAWGWIRVFGKRTFEQFVQADMYFWLPLVHQMQRMFETRQMPQSYEVLYEKTAVFLAAFKSHVECKGAPVGLCEIGDWRAPLLNPDPYPDGFFA
ncbi:MAG: Gfo/Idh/MocA family oxidoreductase [Candidatus Latescibacterota bacterium]